MPKPAVVTRRNLLALAPRVAAHPTHAVVDGVTYPNGLGERARGWDQQQPGTYRGTLAFARDYSARCSPSAATFAPHCM